MTRKTLLRAVPALLALAALTWNVSAQTTNPTTGPGPASSTANKAGEAYPNDPNAANKNKPTAEVVKKAENSTPAQATKRTARKAKKAVKRTGNRAANAVRNTGDNIAKKLPPAKGEKTVDPQGSPKVSP